MKTKFIKYAAALCLTAACLFISAADTKADYVDDTVNRVQYKDTIYISSNYASESYYGGAGYVQITVDNGDRVTNVKSSSKKLLVKKTRERVNTRKLVNYDEDLGKETTTFDSSYLDTYISFFAKKKGTYTVTFDVVNRGGGLKCTKKIKVYVDDTIGNSYPFKYVKYNGKEIWEHYPYATKKSGKLKVKLKKGYSLVSIEIGKWNNKGQLKYTKVKNGKKIKLATSEKYTESYSYGKNHSQTYSFKQDYLFPQTLIKITVKNKKTGEQNTYTENLFTLNKK